KDINYIEDYDFLISAVYEYNILIINSELWFVDMELIDFIEKLLMKESFFILLKTDAINFNNYEYFYKKFFNKEDNKGWIILKRNFPCIKEIGLIIDIKEIIKFYKNYNKLKICSIGFNQEFINNL